MIQKLSCILSKFETNVRLSIAVYEDISVHMAECIVHRWNVSLDGNFSYRNEEHTVNTYGDYKTTQENLQGMLNRVSDYLLSMLRLRVCSDSIIKIMKGILDFIGEIRSDESIIEQIKRAKSFQYYHSCLNDKDIAELVSYITKKN